jgi:hypothetical protein
MKRARIALAAALFLAAAAAQAASPGKTQNAAGIVTRYSPAAHEFAIRDEGGAELGFTWDRNTKFNGVLSRGMKVSVRYTTLPSGENLAQAVSVVK